MDGWMALCPTDMSYMHPIAQHETYSAYGIAMKWNWNEARAHAPYMLARQTYPGTMPACKLCILPYYIDM